MSTVNPKVQAAIDNLTPDMVPIVKSIEDGIKTTQDNYGRYMSLLQQLAGSDKTMLFVVSRALVGAGANAQGVHSALGIIG